jgi:hypothetical protein
MGLEGSRVSNYIEDSVGDDNPVEKIEVWEPLEKKPFDGTVVDIRDTSRPPWPLINEVEQVPTA